jgi:hypothetical protein
MLASKEQLPLGSFMNPRHAEAEVLYADRQWRPVTVLSWHRLDIAYRQAVTDRWIFWLVHLRLESGGEAWFDFDSLNLRPRRHLGLKTWVPGEPSGHPCPQVRPPHLGRPALLVDHQACRHRRCRGDVADGGRRADDRLDRLRQPHPDRPLSQDLLMRSSLRGWATRRRRTAPSNQP